MEPLSLWISQIWVQRMEWTIYRKKPKTSERKGTRTWVPGSHKMPNWDNLLRQSLITLMMQLAPPGLVILAQRFVLGTMLTKGINTKRVCHPCNPEWSSTEIQGGLSCSTGHGPAHQVGAAIHGASDSSSQARSSLSGSKEAGAGASRKDSISCQRAGLGKWRRGGTMCPWVDKTDYDSPVSICLLG